MLEILLEPFQYDYMWRAIWVSALVGSVCAFLSSYLMLKGWSLMGDALAHSIVPGVAFAYLLGLPMAIGAFVAGILAAGSMSVVRKATKLREDTVIGLVFTSFFAIGLLLVSINPTAVNVREIVLGNILTISDEDVLQVVLISAVALTVLLLKWRDFMAVFFDENHASSIGLNVKWLNILFFTLLSAASVAALQTVGACLVIAMLIAPGATAYLFCDRFSRLLLLSVFIGVFTCVAGAYVSYFIDGATGGIIVTLQTLIFFAAFIFAPKHGLLASKRTIKAVGERG